MLLRVQVFKIVQHLLCNLVNESRLILLLIRLLANSLASYLLSRNFCGLRPDSGYACRCCVILGSYSARTRGVTWGGFWPRELVYEGNSRDLWFVRRVGIVSSLALFSLTIVIQSLHILIHKTPCTFWHSKSLLILKLHGRWWRLRHLITFLHLRLRLYCVCLLLLMLIIEINIKSPRLPPSCDHDIQVVVIIVLPQLVAHIFLSLDRILYGHLEWSHASVWKLVLTIYSTTFDLLNVF